MNKGAGCRKLYYKKMEKKWEKKEESKRERRKEGREGRKTSPSLEATEFEAPTGIGNAILSRDWEEQIHKEH